jgi:hypothetical protein
MGRPSSTLGRDVYKILVGKPEIERPIGRPKRR